jgi:hypothetical protein
MKALDTNVLARFFVDDADDAQAVRQRPAAVAALSERAFVSVTVLLEFEWLMRGFYDLPLNRFVVCVEVPDEVWAARTVHGAASLPVGWTARPEGKVSLDIGDAWLAGGASALLQVPSVIVVEEDNVLVNPRHADARRLKARKMREWFFDERLKR